MLASVFLYSGLKETLTGVAKGDDGGNLAGCSSGEGLGRVVNKHGSLGVARENDLGVGALLVSLLNNRNPISELDLFLPQLQRLATYIFLPPSEPRSMIPAMLAGYSTP